MISGCPKDPDEVAESLYLDRLGSAAARRFRAHLRGCLKCRGIYDQNVAMIEVIREAAKLLERTQAAKG